MKTFQSVPLRSIASLLLVGFSAGTYAQTPPDAGALLREAERQQKQLPQPGPQTVPQKPASAAADAVRVTVKSFILSGHTLITEAELQAVLAPWVGRETSFGELQQAVTAIADAYRRHGWFVRPQLPAQDVNSGVIRINILEGKLGEIRIDDGGKTLRVERDMVTDTMTARQKPGDPLNLDALERSSNILNDTPGVAVATILTAGKGPGESDAVVKVQDKPMLAALAQIDNTGSRSTGELKLSMSLTLDNLSGKGDQVSVNTNGSDGSAYLKLAYSMPVGRDGLRVGVSASALKYRVLETFLDPDPAKDPKTKGDAKTYGINASYPLLRSGTQNIALAAAFDRKEYYNETSRVATSEKQIHAGLLSLTGDVLDGLGAGGMTLWGVNLTLGDVDLGKNPINATADSIGPRTDGGYHKWGYNLARLQRLTDKATLWASFTGQTASKNLDSSEKMSLGGPGSVRAYPVSEGTGDEGWQATLEARYNLTAEVQFTTFYDYGSIRLNQKPNYATAAPDNAVSLKGYGFGLSWNQPGQFTLRASLARRIGNNSLPNRTNDKDTDGSYDRTRLWLTGIVFF
jgi:hemolysin activation/secretion protein